MSTTFITCIFDHNEDTLQKWLSTNIPFVFFIRENQWDLEKSKNKHFRVFPKVSISSRELPKNRNLEKDNEIFLQEGHEKLKCCRQICKENPFNTKYFAYIDFDAYHLWKEPTTWNFFLNTFGKQDLYLPKDDTLFIPGCWGKASKSDDFHHSVHWRFCGNFFIGNEKAILEFVDKSEKFYHPFNENILSWNVNLWAYIECNDPLWKPHWYQADHSDSMIHIPDAFGYDLLKDKATIVKCDYLDITPYFPMSCAYIHHKNQNILNIRYVNYWIHENGSYYFPDDDRTIRTYNLCSSINIQPYEAHDNKMMIFDNLHKKNGDAFSQGVEDIRLFHSQHDDHIHFIGTTLSHSYCDKIRMVTGIYEPHKGICTEIKHIKSPHDTWCEKNWSPIPFGNQDGFIYSWNPFRIGILSKDNENLMELVFKHESILPKEYHDMKGSTPFVPFGENLIGLIHFSKEHSPRQYFHKLVVLSRNEFKIVNESAVFCFHKASIEFCIAMCILDTEFGFWISKMDRDPEFVIISQKNILTL